jgi:hypothetical protein
MSDAEWVAPTRRARVIAGGLALLWLALAVPWFMDLGAASNADLSPRQLAEHRRYLLLSSSLGLILNLGTAAVVVSMGVASLRSRVFPPRDMSMPWRMSRRAIAFPRLVAICLVIVVVAIALRALLNVVAIRAALLLP